MAKHKANFDLSVKPSVARELVESALFTKLVPYVVGSPGIGKSAMIHEIAEKFNLKVIDVRLAQCDPTDLCGFPSIDKETNKASYVPMDTFPIEGDKPPKGYQGWLLFLDELSSADRGVQKASYKLILDRMVGLHNLHPHCAIVAAGNLVTDGALVEEMSTALQSRLMHIPVALDKQDWLNWAYSNEIDHTITSFIEFKPDSLYTFSPDHTDHTYSSPRTWEFANRLVKHLGLENDNIQSALSGVLSTGPATEYLQFTNIYKNIPSINTIINNPASADIPDEPGTMYALTGYIASNINKSNSEKLLIYVNRLPAEFQVICVRSVLGRDKELKTDKHILAWINKNAKAFLA